MTTELGSTGFCVGDVIALKSGGISMTAYSLDDEGKVIVHWFPDDKKVNAARFFPSQLTLKNSPFLGLAEINKLVSTEISPALKMRLEVMAQRHVPAWKAGDVVVLNSGGPSLSVGQVIEEQVSVDWVDKKGEHHQARFHPAQVSPPSQDENPLSDWTDAELKELEKLISGGVTE